MIATIVNCAAVLVGAVLGSLFHRKITEKYKRVIYLGIGMISLVIGIIMALETQRILFVALSLVIGGILGTWWNVEGGILRFGNLLERTFGRSAEGNRQGFAHAFLSASILFCVGAMTIVGSFKAGAEGNYDLLLTKSVMDGAMAVLLTAAMGVGVAFSAITILIYQGGLTLFAAFLKPYISPLVLSELSGTGGILVMMIGLNLLNLKEIKTGNFLPSLGLILAFALLEPVFQSIILH